jgi:hypothetical protein
MTKNEDERPQEPDSKLAYEAPMLISYGSMRDITKTLASGADDSDGFQS